MSRGSRRRRGGDARLGAERSVEEDVRDELAAHLAFREEELVAQGWPRERARAEALRAFGDLGSYADEWRSITQRTRRLRRRAETLESLWTDLVFAARLLRKAPGFAVVAVVTLAVGIGATTAIFSLVNGVLLRPLPYDHPGRLVDVQEVERHGLADLPYSNMLDLRAESRSLDGLASYGAWTTEVEGTDRPWRVRTASVSADFFRVLGGHAAVGRLPTPDEHVLGAPAVAVVSWDFWRTRLAAAGSLQGVRLRGRLDYAVVGVMPRGFDFPAGTEMWVPVEQYDTATNSLSRNVHNWSVVGRLRPGLSLSQSAAELNQLLARLRRLYDPAFDGRGVALRPLQDAVTGPLQAPLYLLLVAAAILLAAACSNIASTMLARGTARAPEFALRTALGAGRLRLARQLVTESALLAALGCGAGLGVALGLLRGIGALAPARLHLAAAGMDGWVLGFAILVTASTAALVGLLPALQVSRADPGRMLREGGRTGAGASRLRVWGALVATQVGIATLLVAASGLLLHSFARILAVDPGFRVGRMLTAAVSLPPGVAAADDDHRAAFYARVLQQLAGLPGVEAVGVTNAFPLSGVNTSGRFGIEGVAPGPDGKGPGIAGYRTVNDGYFAAMGIPLERGRVFSAADIAGAQPVVIVNRALARQQFPHDDPIGRRIRLQSNLDDRGDGWLTIVGVVGDVRHFDLTSLPSPETYVPYTQRLSRNSGAVFVVRSRGDPAALIVPVQRTIAAAAPEVVPRVETGAERLGATLTSHRFTLVVLGGFGLAALLLACVGVYGIVSYAAAERTREIGIRIALGAPSASIRWQVQRGALRMAGLGIVVGLAAAIALGRLMRSLLFDTRALDVASLAASLVLLACAAWVASWIPAWRGARLDPIVAIRSE